MNSTILGADQAEGPQAAQQDLDAQTGPIGAPIKLSNPECAADRNSMDLDSKNVEATNFENSSDLKSLNIKNQMPELGDEA